MHFKILDLHICVETNTQRLKQALGKNLGGGGGEEKDDCVSSQISKFDSFLAEVPTHSNEQTLSYGYDMIQNKHFCEKLQHQVT